MSAIVVGSLLTLGQAAAAESTVTVKNPTNGIYVNTNRARNRYLSLTAMLLPTNDSFVGLDLLRIPPIPGTCIYYRVGYDAGTEANDERITGGNGASGMDANTSVHIHRGGRRRHGSQWWNQ